MQNGNMDEITIKQARIEQKINASISSVITIVNIKHNNGRDQRA